MVKKTKTTQRSKEEQWRKRMASQGQRTGFAGGVTSSATTDMMDDGRDETRIPAPPRPRSTTMTAPGRTQASAATATQRRAATAARTSRTRLTANTLTIEEEMRYVRSDIRRLIILTAICLAVIIALSFVIPR
ncbi:MAG TPA: hypothetical protein VGE45_09260 [Chloroflexia bacterium]|jgi:hypothetical protein